MIDNKTMFLVTTDDNVTVIGVATTKTYAQAYALAWLDKQYNEGEWEAIFEEEGVQNKSEFVRKMLYGDKALWDTFDITIKEIPVLDHKLAW